MSILRYEKYDLETVQKDGQTWLRLGQLAQPLACQKSTLLRIINRHQHRFIPHEAQKILLPSNGGMQAQWIVSLAGADRLGINLGTKQGDNFREWALGLIAGVRRGRQQSFTLTSPGATPPALEVVQALDEVERLFSLSQLSVDVLRDLKLGVRAIPGDSLLDAYADEWEEGADLMGRGTSILNKVKQKVARSGYQPESIRRYVKNRRKLLGKDKSAPRLLGGEG
jgi:hypothetical protein